MLNLLPDRYTDKEIRSIHIGNLVGEHVGVVGIEAQLLVTIKDGTFVVEQVVDAQVEEEIIPFVTLRETAIEIEGEGGLQRGLVQHKRNADVALCVVQHTFLGVVVGVHVEVHISHKVSVEAHPPVFR